MGLIRRNLRGFLPATVVVASLVVAASSVSAQSPVQLPTVWNDAVHDLAKNIATTVTSSHTLSIDVKDITPGAPVDLARFRQALEAQITVQGGRLVTPSPGAPPADAQVQVRISQNVEGYLLVADIHLADSEQAAIVAVASAGEPPPQPGPMPAIQRKIVWRQSRPILDFAQTVTPTNHTLWYVLETDRLVVHDFNDGAQVLQQAGPISPLSASRDLRGRLSLTDATHLTAWIAGSRCDGQWNPGFTVSCSPNPGEQWPMGRTAWVFDAPRNYFSGGMILSYDLVAKYPPFYSASSPSSVTGGRSASRWILTGLDGQAQLFLGRSQPASTFAGWGSDILSLAPVCGSAWQVLVTGPGDWTQSDRIQLYEITGSRATAVGQPVDVPGPILALWASGDGKSARMVSRNLETGLYEASIVSVSCDR
jgi:hypothetical protein